MNTGVETTSFGKLPNGSEATLFTLRSSGGVIAKITNYGTIITELQAPDRDGRLGDVVLGFDNLQQYLDGHPYFGCTVGRVANRIARGQFTLNGKTYRLAVNNGPNHLHGGLKGFDKVLWRAEPQAGAAVKFTYRSVDGEEGYPGNLDVTVLMTLTDQNGLRIDYKATADAPSPVNLTNHSYFNLLAGAGDVLSHEMILTADTYTPTDETSIPTGEIRSVKGTPMDFASAQTIGSRIAQVVGERVGYDHNYVIRGGGTAEPVLASLVYEPRTGRTLETYTTHPGVQFYTGNFLDGSLVGKNGIVYSQHTGFCLETQHFPDSVNHPNFPSVILNPGQIYKQTTIYQLGVR